MTDTASSVHSAGAGRQRSLITKAILTIVGIALFFGFLTLGTWQVQRRAWKLDLIERVDQRLHAAPVAVPAPAQWPRVDATGYEYLPVQTEGRWLTDKTVFTQALSDLGSGFWVLTPLEQADGTQIIVNRGFIPEKMRSQGIPAAPEGMVTVQGLMRLPELHGGFLRTNDPAADRWFSRDVAAIASAKGLSRAAPFFIDEGLPPAATRTPAPAPVATDGPWPRAGLTVVSFHNSHAVYAVTWYGLALMVLGAAYLVIRHERKLRQRSGQQ